MGNPCIRSCLSWCSIQLQRLADISIPAEISVLCQGTNAAIAWAEANAFFRIMWEQWCMLQSCDEPWMTETQSKMGISPSELLLLVCRVIHQVNLDDWEPARSNTELFTRLRKAAHILLKASGFQLARRVLKQYVARNTATAWPEWRSAVRRTERQCDMSCLEKVLHVSFPNLGAAPRTMVNSMLVHPGETALLLKDIGFTPKPQLSPTLASSMSSIDLSSFRRTGARAERAIRDLFQGKTSVHRTSQSLRGSEHRFSLARLSDLSMSLGSMSLSGKSRGMGSSQS